MKTALTLGFAFLATALAAVGTFAHRPSAPSEGAVSRRRPSGTPPDARIGAAIDAALTRKDYAEAERIVRANLQGPYGAGMRRYLPALLFHRGAEAEALTETMALFHGRYGPWSPDSVRMAPVLEVALRLGRARDADEIATWIEENDVVIFSSFPALNKPDALPTPARRLAYAFLVLAARAQGEMDGAARLRYCERAADLAPRDVPVLFQLALAYADRNAKGDPARTEGLLRRAYALLPPNSAARRDLRTDAQIRVQIDPAGPNARATLNADIDRSIRENVARGEAQNAAKDRERARFMAERDARRLSHATPAPRP